MMITRIETIHDLQNLEVVNWSGELRKIVLFEDAELLQLATLCNAYCTKALHKLANATGLSFKKDLANLKDLQFLDMNCVFATYACDMFMAASKLYKLNDPSNTEVEYAMYMQTFSRYQQMLNILGTMQCSRIMQEMCLETGLPTDAQQQLLKRNS